MFVALIIIGTVSLLFSKLGYSSLQGFLFGLFITSAVLLIYFFIENTIKTNFKKEMAFLSLWFLLYFVFFVSVSAIIAVRYLIPVLPAAIMIFAKTSENIKAKKVFQAITVIAGIVISLFLAQSDYALANAYKNFAQYIKDTYASKNVYFTGHLGFQYYMEKNDFLAVDSNENKYPKNSITVSPALPVPQKVNKKIIGNAKSIVNKFVFLDNPFRTMNPEVQAGFHLNMYGLLPYSFSKMPLEKFTIYEIK